MPNKKPQKSINLALQGGGAHGAFAWGVLDKILEDGRIDIEGICATSAGTMNACAMAYGKMLGGPEKARETLHNFWYKIHEVGQRYSPIRSTPMEQFLGQSINHWNMDNSLSYFLFDTITRAFSPYQYNFLDFNPLRDVLAETIDFKLLKQCDCIKLFISTTHVKTGKVRVFEAEELTIDVALASACLPFLFKAVEIKGEHYWDGGYMGNPALYPLFYKTDSRDVMIVHINPIERRELPVTGPEIMNRVNEISFNSSLLKEMRAIAFVKKLIENDMLKDEHKDRFKDILVHSIRADQAMCDLSVASKFSSDWNFLTYLRDKGRDAMGRWLKKHFDDLGKNTTVDLNKEFLKSITEMFEEKLEKTGPKCNI